MRWNTMSGDIPRVCALADILLGAALADRQYDDGEFVALASTLMKVLGVAALPAEVIDHMRTFDVDAHNVSSSLERLNLEGARARTDLLKVLARVVHADDVVHEAERAYLLEVGAALGIEQAKVAAFLTAGA